MILYLSNLFPSRLASLKHYMKRTVDILFVPMFINLTLTRRYESLPKIRVSAHEKSTDVYRIPGVCLCWRLLRDGNPTDAQTESPIRIWMKNDASSYPGTFPDSKCRGSSTSSTFTGTRSRDFTGMNHLNRWSSIKIASNLRVSKDPRERTWTARRSCGDFLRDSVLRRDDWQVVGVSTYLRATTVWPPRLVSGDSVWH